MKNSGENTQDNFDQLNSTCPLPREYYKRVPEEIRESYRQACRKMSALPAKKAGAAFKLAVTLWKPIATALREDFEKQRQARALPHNMQFTDYFVQFQRAADNEFKRARKPAKAAPKPKVAKKKKAKAGPARKRRK
ncbi:MAG: hypothetical protein WC299_01940 [Kiritimatiellia bacterium]